MAVPNGRLSTASLTPIPARFHTHGTTAYLQADAAAAFLRVAAAFEAEFGKPLVAMSFYRPLSDQVRIFLKNYYRYNGARRSGTTDRSYNGATYRKRTGMAPVASPGNSNHGLGVAVDLQSGVNIRGSKEHAWMLSTGAEYGFSWDEGRRVNEAWHFRYLPSKDRMKHLRVPDTGVIASATAGGTTVADLAVTQQRLARLGYAPGPVDGKLGDRTKAAVKQFQQDYGITTDGVPGPTTRKAIDTMATIAEDIKALSKKLDALPVKILHQDIPLEGTFKGQSGNLTGLRKWYAHDMAEIKALIRGSQAAVLKAVQESGKAQGLTDAQIQAIAEAAAEAAARVSAEDVAEQLTVTAKGE